jgi:integrase
LRFTAYTKRQYVTLGNAEQGWTKAKAELELQNTLADVRRGIWRRPVREVVQEPAEAQTFHEYALEWWNRATVQLARKTQLDYRWRLEEHLFPYFADYSLDTITFDTVERYIAMKQGSLSGRSINMTVGLLAQILDTAVERELIPRNPARGRRRRAKEMTPTRSYLDNASQIEALLAAAGELDRKAPAACRHIQRRAMIATLTYAGLRVGEMLSLRWRNVDLATGWLTVGESKTDAGRGRRVKIRGALRDELARVRADSLGKVDEYVFPTSTGRSLGKDNFRCRVLTPAINRANEQRQARGLPVLPDKLTSAQDVRERALRARRGAPGSDG